MDGVKGMLFSKTIWATMIAILATVSAMAGWDIGNTDGLAEQIVALIAGLFAIYGRVVAVTKIIK